MHTCVCAPVFGYVLTCASPSAHMHDFCVFFLCMSCCVCVCVSTNHRDYIKRAFERVVKEEGLPPTQAATRALLLAKEEVWRVCVYVYVCACVYVCVWWVRPQRCV